MDDTLSKITDDKANVDEAFSNKYVYIDSPDNKSWILIGVILVIALLFGVYKYLRSRYNRRHLRVNPGGIDNENEMNENL